MNQTELEARLQTVEDIIAIDRLEKIYGYYLDSKQIRKIVDCFSEKAESIEIGDRGFYKGIKGIRKFFTDFEGKGDPTDHTSVPPGRMGFHMMHQGVITVAPDGKTAKGRWYLVMIQARSLKPGGPNRSVLAHGVYENEFVKEAGVWKFSKLFMSIHYRSPIAGGWTEVPNMDVGSVPGRDGEPTFYHPYPNLEILPWHFKHLVTSK